jgi:hypothetical protein
LAEALKAQNTILCNKILDEIREVYHKHRYATNEPSDAYSKVGTKGNLDNREARANNQEGRANNQEGGANDWESNNGSQSNPDNDYLLVLEGFVT